MICKEVFMAQSTYTLTKGTEEGCGELSEDSQCSGQDSNCAPPNQKTSALLLHQITGRMFSSLWKEVVLVLLEVLLWHLPGVVGANHKKFDLQAEILSQDPLGMQHECCLLKCDVL